MNFRVAHEMQPIEASLIIWATVHAELCLALRHPESKGQTREITLDFVQALGTMLVERGLLSAAELAVFQQVQPESSPGAAT